MSYTKPEVNIYGENSNSINLLEWPEKLHRYNSKNG